MNNDAILKEFDELHTSGDRSKTARLRELFEQIEALKNRGITHSQIINAMKKHGLEFDLKTFEALLYRIKKERSRSATDGETNRCNVSDFMTMFQALQNKLQADGNLAGERVLHALWSLASEYGVSEGMVEDAITKMIASGQPLNHSATTV